MEIGYGNVFTLHAIPGKTYTKVHPYKMDGYIATGEVTTLYFQGSWDDCMAEALLQCSAGTRLLQVTATVVAEEGGVCKLTVSRAVYVSNSSSDQSDITAGTAGESEYNPSYSFDVSGQAVSILLYPKIQEWMDSASKAERIALQALANGAKPDEFVEIGLNNQVTRSVISDILANSPEIMDFVTKNPPQWYTFGMVIRSTFKVDPSKSSADVSGIGTIQKPPGPFGNVKIGKKRNFLYIGCSYQTVGDVTTCTKSHLLSDEGGWSTDIYGAKS